ncbi:MAG: hypothetical protein VW127_03135 [Flavobacteriaceae bacterium]|jgi:hypothetical protein
MNKSLNTIVFTIVFILVTTNTLEAQEAYVKIEQDSTITQLMKTKIQIDTEDYTSKFYTIQLFYGDNKKAEELFQNFKKIFPEWYADLSFETPNYKVQVGRFKNYYLGLNKLKEIKKEYPAAFLLELKN